MAKNLLQQLEFEWYSAKNPSGIPDNPRLEEVKKAYWHSQVGEAGAYEPLLSLEMRWLKSLTGVTSDHYDEMWQQAVAGASLTTQGNTTANKVEYYTHVSP